MESILIAIDYREPIWLAVAFLFGLGASRAGLPPLVGFLIAGFMLHALGARGGQFLNEVADLGVTMLLFTIGLKLRLSSLIRPEVWVTTLVHMSASVLLFTAVLLGLGALGIALLAGLSLPQSAVVAFAASFSSTVFAVKVLEETGETGARHGRVAIGILILQDVIAVLFLVAATAKLPSPWAVALLALIPMRRFLGAVLTRTGHGELMVLYALVLALGGAAVFEAVGLKGDLGALVAGLLLAGHPKASELAKALVGFKDLFLIGFFLSVGLTGLPDLSGIGIAMILVLLLPVKAGLFFWLLTRLRLRARTAALGALSLANYSEFGLIVETIAVGAGWLDPGWIPITAVAVALSFALAAPLNLAADRLYARHRPRLKRWERDERLADDGAVDLTAASIAVLGMGRVGTGAYDVLRNLYGETLFGVDYDEERVRQHNAAGRRAIHGDPSSAEFWSRVGEAHCDMSLVLLTLPAHRANMQAVARLRERGYQGRIAAIARFADEQRELQDAGVTAFNIYAEAGAGFAEHVAGEVPSGLRGG